MKHEQYEHTHKNANTNKTHFIRVLMAQMISQYIEMKSKTVYTKWAVTCVRSPEEKTQRKWSWRMKHEQYEHTHNNANTNKTHFNRVLISRFINEISKTS